MLRLKLIHGGYRRGPRVLIRSISVVLCLWCAFPHVLPAQTNTDVISLSAYQEKLLAWQALLAQSNDAAQVATIQQEVAAIRQVELPTGAVVTLHPLLGDPDAGAIDVAMAQLYLAAAINELDAAANDDTVARLLLLTQIFQRTEFVERDSLWQRFWRWLRSWLPTVEPTESSAAPMAPLFQWLGWALIGIGAALLIWLLSYWLQSLLASFIGGVERRQPTEDQSLPQSAAEARAHAHQLANAGSYRNAVRHLYLSALLALHERNRITYQQSDTNREVLTAVRNQPQLHQQLQPVIETFDDVWYGVHEPDRTSFDSYVAAVEKLEEVQ